MMELDISSVKPTNIAILLQSLVFMLKSSPDFLLIHHQGNLKPNQYFSILSILRISDNTALIFTILNTLLVLYSLKLIFIDKKVNSSIEILIKVIFPIHIFIAINLINKNCQCKFITILLLAITIFVVYLKDIFLDLRAENFSLDRSFKQYHRILSDILMLLCAVFSLVSKESNLIFILFVTALCIIKSFVLFKFVNYESPLIQYAAYLCEPLSFISLVTISSKLFFAIDISPVIWTYSAIILFYCLQENSLIRNLLEQNYSSHLVKDKVSFEHQSITNSQLEQNFLIFLSIFKAILKLNDRQNNQDCFMKFSPDFLHCVENYYLKVQQNIKGFPLNNFVPRQFPNDKNTFQVTQQWERYWKAIESFAKTNPKMSQKFIRFVIYSLPSINNLFQTRMIYLSYISNDFFQNDQSQESKNGGFVENLIKVIDRNFVMSKDKNKKYSEILISFLHTWNSQENYEKIQKDDQLCLQFEHQYGSTIYEDSYKEIILQESLEGQFIRYVDIQTSMIKFIESKQDFTGCELKERILDIKKSKNRVVEIFEKFKGASCKSQILLKYGFYRFMLNLPETAKEQIDKLQNFHIDQKKGQLKLQMKSKFNRKAPQNSEIDNQAFFMISSVKNKGQLVYTCQKFINIMELKSEFSLLNRQNNNNLTLSSFMLPHWIQKHKEMIQSLQIYEKSINHTKKHYFMQSLFSKQVYEVQLNLHHITSCSDDLYIAVNVTYKKLKYLAVFESGKRIYMRQIKIIQTDSSGSKDICVMQNICRVEEVHFGKKYRFIIKYISNSHANTQISKLMQFFKQKSPFPSSQNSQYSKHNDRDIEVQKNFLVYKKKHYFLKDNFCRMISWKIIVILILVVLLLTMSSLISSDNVNRANLFDFKYLMEERFINDNLKLLNNLLLVFVTATPRVIFQPISSDKKTFEASLVKTIRHDIKTVGERGIQVNKVKQFGLIMYRITQSPEYPIDDKFFSSSLQFDIKYLEFLKNLNISSEFQQSQIFPDVDQGLKEIYKLQMVSFYRNFIDKFSGQQSEDKIEESLQRLIIEQLEFENRRIFDFSMIVWSIITLGTFGFTCLYLVYTKKMSSFLSSVRNLPKESINFMKQNLSNLTQIIKQQKITDEDLDVLESIKTRPLIYSYESQAKLEISGFKITKQMAQQNRFPYSKSSKKILLFMFVFFGLSLVALRQIYILGAQDIEQFRIFLQGTSELSSFLSKNTKISSLIFDGMISSNRTSSQTTLNLIRQIKTIDMMKIMNMVEPIQEQVDSYLFAPSKITTTGFDQNTSGLKLIDLSFMQAKAKSIKIYELMSNQLKKEQQAIIDAQFIVRMSQLINQFTSMTNNILQVTKFNLYQSHFTVQSYILIFTVWVVFVGGCIGGSVFYKCYEDDKIVFEEVLSLVSMEHMLKVPELGVFVHRSKQLQKDLSSD